MIDKKNMILNHKIAYVWYITVNHLLKTDQDIE